MKYCPRQKSKLRRVRVFFLLFTLICIGLSIGLAFGLRGTALAVIPRPNATGQRAFPAIRWLDRHVLSLSVPIADSSEITWIARAGNLEISLPLAAAEALGDDFLEQDVNLRREGDRAILVIPLDNLPPIFSLRRTAAGITVHWQQAGLAGKRIAIDPGHGGHDPGAVGGLLGLCEKDVTLAIALELNDLLIAAGAETFLTRTTDTLVDTNVKPGHNASPDFWKRHDLVQEYQPDFFISIHNNSWKTKNAYGIETYYNPGTLNGFTSKQAAEAVQKSLVAEFGRLNRGIKKKTDAVLRVDAPAVLAEILFISNWEEEAILAAPDFPGRAAGALFRGIAAYFEEAGGE